MKILSTGRMNQLAAGGRRDLAVYAASIYPDFELPRHLELLVTKLEAVERGEIRKLMISMPPRHGKSVMASWLFPCWYLGRDPRRSVAICSYGQGLAEDFGRRVFRTVTSPMHKRIFPDAKLVTDIGASERFELQAGGAFYSVPRSGALTGRGCSLLICDDLTKDAQEAASPAVQKQVQDFFTRVALTRLTPDGAVVLVGTRWGSHDLFNFLLDERGEKDWEIINFPAIAESEGDPLGRAPGEALWPERFSVKHLIQKKYEVGIGGFTTLYLGRPAAESGIIFKREQFRTYTQVPQLKRTIVSLDSAFKTNQRADFSAIQTWGEGQTGFYLLARWKDKVEFPELKRVLVSICDQWKPGEVLIEDAASGQSLIQELRTLTSLPLRPIKPDRDKEARAQSCTGMLEAGRVFLPADAPWLGDFIDELAGFPHMRHDDEVDACTQALIFLRGDGDQFGYLDFAAGGGLERVFDSVVSAAAKITRNIFGKRIDNPRDDNIGKSRLYEHEARLRGLDVGQVQVNMSGSGVWKPEQAPACPNCHSVCVILLGPKFHCNQCGTDAPNPKIVQEVIYAGRGGYIARRLQ